MSTNDLCGCVNDEECMIDTSCKMGDLGCNAYGKNNCRLCAGEEPLPAGSPDYLPCKWLCNKDGTCSANADGIFSSESDCLSSCSSTNSRACLEAISKKCGKTDRQCMNKQQRDNLSYCINYKRDYSSRGANVAPYQCYNNGVKDLTTINNYLNSMCPEPDYSKCDCSTCMVDYGCTMGSQGCNKNDVLYCRDCGFGRNPKCRWKCSGSTGKCISDASGTFSTKKECEDDCATCWPNCKWSCDSNGKCKPSDSGIFDDKDSCLSNCSKCLGQMESLCGNLPCTNDEEFFAKRSCILGKFNADNNYLRCSNQVEFDDNLRTYLRRTCDNNLGWCTCQMTGPQAPIPYPADTCISVHEEGGNIIYMPHYLIECTGHKNNKKGCINSPANCVWHGYVN